jgi:hypothetical protein
VPKAIIGNNWIILDCRNSLPEKRPGATIPGPVSGYSGVEKIHDGLLPGKRTPVPGPLSAGPAPAPHIPGNRAISLTIYFNPWKPCGFAHDRPPEKKTAQYAMTRRCP